MKANYLVSLLLVPLLASATAFAEVNAPSTESMIEQLKPKPARKTRSLMVERAPEQAVATPAAQPVVQAATPTAVEPATVVQVNGGQSAPMAPVSPTVASSATAASSPAVAAPTVASIETEQPGNEAADTGKSELSLNIFFDFNSARVKTESQDSLSRLAQALQSEALVKSRFLIEGHTDAKGNPGTNLMLSWQRAEAVSNFLVRKGVNKNRLQAIGKGSTELANALSPDSAENRRVKIINLD